MKGRGSAVSSIKELAKKFKKSEEEIIRLAQSHLVPRNMRVPGDSIILGPAGANRLAQILAAEDEQKRGKKRQTLYPNQSAEGRYYSQPFKPPQPEAYRLSPISYGFGNPYYDYGVEMWYPGMDTSMSFTYYRPAYSLPGGNRWPAPVRPFYPEFRRRGGYIRRGLCWPLQRRRGVGFLTPPVGMGAGLSPPSGGPPVQGGLPPYVADQGFYPGSPTSPPSNMKDGYAVVPGYEHLLGIPPLETDDPAVEMQSRAFAEPGSGQTGGGDPEAMINGGDLAGGQTSPRFIIKDGCAVVPGYEHLLGIPPLETDDPAVETPSGGSPESSSGPTKFEYHHTRPEPDSGVNQLPTEDYGRKEGEKVSQPGFSSPIEESPAAGEETRDAGNQVESGPIISTQKQQSTDDWKSLPWPLSEWARLTGMANPAPVEEEDVLLETDLDGPGGTGSTHDEKGEEPVNKPEVAQENTENEVEVEQGLSVIEETEVEDETDKIDYQEAHDTQTAERKQTKEERRKMKRNGRRFIFPRFRHHPS